MRISRRWPHLARVPGLLDFEAVHIALSGMIWFYICRHIESEREAGDCLSEDFPPRLAPSPCEPQLNSWDLPFSPAGAQGIPCKVTQFPTIRCSLVPESRPMWCRCSS